MMKLVEMLKHLVATPLDKYILAFIATSTGALYLSQVLDGFVPRMMVFIFAILLLQLFARRFGVRHLNGTFNAVLKSLAERMKNGR